MILIKIENVSKYYQSGHFLHSKKVTALSGISLDIHKGECIAVVGESGSGKSTLGRLVVGLEPPSDGCILYENQKLDPKHLDPKVRQGLQMVYQNSFEATNPRFTAKQIVEEPIRYFNLVPKEKRSETITKLLLNVGIPEVDINKKAHEFSGGQLQRICIARALAAEPQLILLDEPLSSLDVSVQAQILNLFKKIKEDYGLTYLLISHDLETAYNIADRLVVMFSGKIVEKIDDIELFSQLAHPYTALLLGKSSSQAIVHGSTDTKSERGCVYAKRCAYADNQKCQNEIPELKEVTNGHQIACFKRDLLMQKSKNSIREGGN